MKFEEREILFIGSEKGKEELKKMLEGVERVKLPKREREKLRKIALSFVEGEHMFKTLTE